MKPLYLELKNIGPFRQETLDFTLLGDIFLICGKTGAGKTTIFDAITYALYGKLPGQRSSISVKQIRSDFAPLDEEAYVKLKFLLHNKVFHVTRILPRDYKTKNGTNSNKPEELLITEITESTEKNIPGKKTELDNFLATNIGLTPEEFSRIVLLPQGEFADFLLQNSTERTETLAKLFPVQEYEEIIQETKERTAKLTAELNSTMQQLENYGLEYNPEKEKKEIEELKVQIIQWQQKQNEVTEKLLKLEKNIIKYTDQLETFERVEKLQEEKDLLESKRLEIEEQEKQLQLSIQAEPVWLASKDFERAEKNLERLENQKKDLIKTQNESQNILNQILLKTEEINELSEKNKKMSLLLNNLKNSLEEETKLAELIKTKLDIEKQEKILNSQIEEFETKQNLILKEIDNTKRQIDLENQEVITEKLQQASILLQNTEKTLNSAKDKALKIIHKTELEKKLEKKQQEESELKTELKKAKQELDQQKQKEYAKFLATSLKKDSPCPVCGSIHHPNPAGQELDFMEQDLTLEKQIQSLEERFSATFSERANIEGQLNLLNSSLDSLKDVPNEEVVQQEYLTAKDNLSQIQNKLEKVSKTTKELNSLQDNLSDILASIEPLKQKSTEFKIKLSTFSTEINHLQKKLESMLQDSSKYGITETKVADCYKKLNNIILQQETQIENFFQNKQQEEKQLEKFGGILLGLATEIENSNKEHLVFKQRLKETLEKSCFKDCEEAKKAKLTPEIFSEIETKVNQWKQSFSKNETLLKQEKSNLKGTKEEATKHLYQAQNESSTLKDTISKEQEQYNKFISEKEQRSAKLNQWKELEKKRTELVQQESLHRQLYNDISGKNQKKVALTTWILGVYLDEIATYANSRLNRISEGRYTLLMNQSKTAGKGAKGLDLEVFDSFTGKARPCNTLSGGEVFMASISLALALTDVVSNRAGGITLDSLFIDEGFGSLDETSLEKALSILDEIRDSRCIGLISHVAEMKSRIPARLEIIKTSSGSKICPLVEA